MITLHGGGYIKFKHKENQWALIEKPQNDWASPGRSTRSSSVNDAGCAWKFRASGFFEQR